MSDVQARLGHALLKSLGELRQQKGEVSLEDVGDMFVHLSSTLSPPDSVLDRVLHDEIGKLVQYIQDAKKEIFAISVNEKTDTALMDASQHLDEVIKATEAATNTIMDAADHIQAAAAGIGGEKEQEIMDASTRIYEACNFQDITGQRINKVIRLINNIEERVNKLNELFGNDDVNGNVVLMPANVNNEASLLNGPQLSSTTPTQDDIDALFNSISVKKG